MVNEPLLAFLDSVYPLYPGGIPLAEEKDAAQDMPRLTMLAKGLTGFSGAAGDLLKSIVEKGLKLNCRDVNFVWHDTCDSQDSLLAKLSAALTAQGPQATLIVLGDLFSEDNLDKLKSLCKVIVTLELVAVLDDGALKRRLWEDIRDAV